MGAAAAVSFARAGYDVLLWVRRPEAVQGLRSDIDRLGLQLQQAAGLVAQPIGAISVTTQLDDIDGKADLILDAIAEDMAQKVDLFSRLKAAKARGALFITTTSGLSITEMGRRADCGTQLVGAHFWNPPHLMPLVEVIRGEDTSDEVLDIVIDLIRGIGKIPVRVNRDAPGFIGNRLLHALFREAVAIVERGIASAEDVDLVARLTFGLRMPAVGPLENMDLVGLDLIRSIHAYLLQDLDASATPQPLLTEMVDTDRLGMKRGKGFYDWSTRDSAELLSRRDAQIVRQIAYLQSTGAMPSPANADEQA